MIIPNIYIWTNKKCSKPPTSNCFVLDLLFPQRTVWPWESLGKCSPTAYLDLFGRVYGSLREGKCWLYAYIWIYLVSVNGSYFSSNIYPHEACDSRYSSGLQLCDIHQSLGQITSKHWISMDILNKRGQLPDGCQSQFAISHPSYKEPHQSQVAC